MTIETFMKNNKIRNEKIVKIWVKNGLIPKSSLEKNYIPDSARVPYTKARAKTVDSIYVSIVRASCKRMHVMPQLYKICDDEFNNYINILERASLIIKRETDGIIYYDATLKSNEYCGKIRKFVLDIIKSFAIGATEAILKKE